jgi:hypothetical protein
VECIRNLGCEKSSIPVNKKVIRREVAEKTVNGMIFYFNFKELLFKNENERFGRNLGDN